MAVLTDKKVLRNFKIVLPKHTDFRYFNFIWQVGDSFIGANSYNVLIYKEVAKDLKDFIELEEGLKNARFINPETNEYVTFDDVLPNYLNLFKMINDSYEQYFLTRYNDIAFFNRFLDKLSDKVYLYIDTKTLITIERLRKFITFNKIYIKPDASICALVGPDWLFIFSIAKETEFDRINKIK